jgi:DNA-binding HxlR family transcriptional regulator
MSRKRPPLPGTKVRGSTSGRAIMAALDLFGRRWALRVLWELRRAPLTFRELQAACGTISPAVLNTRLAELRSARLIAAQAGGYGLTEHGTALLDAIAPLHDWADRWAAALRR